MLRLLKISIAYIIDASFTSWLLFAIFLVCGLKVKAQAPVKKYRFYRLTSELIIELITRQLSHYAPLSHFAPHYAIFISDYLFKQPLTTQGGLEISPLFILNTTFSKILFSFCNN